MTPQKYYASVKIFQYTVCDLVLGQGLAVGHRARLQNFEEFERRFKECLSSSAIRTKFEQHYKQGLNVVSELEQLLSLEDSHLQQERYIFLFLSLSLPLPSPTLPLLCLPPSVPPPLSHSLPTISIYPILSFKSCPISLLPLSISMYFNILLHRERVRSELATNQNRAQQLKQQLPVLVANSDQLIAEAVDEVTTLSSVAMRDLLSQLPSLVDNYQLPFEPNDLSQYKAGLYSYFDEKLSAELERVNATALTSMYETTQTKLIGEYGV